MSRKKKRFRNFVILEHVTLDSSDWQDLTHSEMLVYIYIKRNYNGNNNGKILFKYTEFKNIFAPATLSRALKGLETKEWIEKTRYGGLYRYYNLYRLTGKFDRF